MLIIKRKRKHIKNGRNTDDFTHLVESSFCSGRNDSILDSLPRDERSMKIFYNALTSLWASQVALVVMNPLANAGDIRDAGFSLGREDPQEESMATHSSTRAWKIPWMKEPGRLQSMGSQRVGHD